MTAEEFFEWARSCATKRASAVAVRKHLYDKRSSSPLVSSGSGGDPMAYIDSAMDREREIDAEIARYDAIQRRAMLVIQEVYKYVPGPAGAGARRPGHAALGGRRLEADGGGQLRHPRHAHVTEEMARWL